MRIALDAMGGDFAPGPIVAGAVDAVQANEALEIVLVGDRDRVQHALGEQQNHPRLQVLHTSQVIEMHEKPSVLRTKKDSSIAKCWELMAMRKVDAVVSAGNTGAVAAAGLFTRLFVKGVKRPGIAVVLPSLRGPVVLLDVGANAVCKPEHLFQYGVMGSIYAREIVGIDSPKIGLMNIGTEEVKGNDLVRETHELFRSSHLKDQFQGNVEGRDLCQGTVNVLVCDGFVGNIVLKVSEGMLEMIMKMTTGAIMGSLENERHLAEQALRKFENDHHHSSFGGAPLLGVDGICIIAHGGSDQRAIFNALQRAIQHSDTQLNALIASDLERSPMPTAAP